MNETIKPKPEIIVVTRARLAFARLDEAEQSKDPQGNPRGAKKFSCTLLLDPSNVEHKVTIAAVKAAAKKVCVAKWGEPSEWPKANPATGMGGLILCFGSGNDLPKVYDGYADRFYIKCGDTSRPLLGTRDGKLVQKHEDGTYRIVDKEGNLTLEKVSPDRVPYAGCYVRARISPWVYFPTPKRPLSANGVNMNIRSAQFMEPGSAFGGEAASRSAEEEFEAYGDAPVGGGQAGGPESDPFG